ncbi:hypothetical protein WA556_004113, partial [Blastocystis sp. ATCC 50177/Nand II]
MPKLLDKRQSASDLFDAIKEAPDSVPSSVIPRLLGILGEGIDDEEILQKILDILLFLTELKQVENNEILLIENVSTLLCENSYVEILLSLFDSPDVFTRISAIQILKNCIAVNQSIVEKSILGCPMGLQKLVDVLRDNREEVRNEMLLLLRSLTRRNQEICKFIAFQDGYDILIAILRKESGTIARDCLHIIYNMVANSVLTLKLFSQRPFLLAIIDVLSVSDIVSASSAEPSPRPDVSLLPAEALSDHIIDLTKYDELERVNNMDIQCYQFAVSILELVMTLEPYKDDAERLQIAQPIVEQNRSVLHANPQYIFNLLYFTLYQVRQQAPAEADAAEAQPEPCEHSKDDLLDIATRCEPLLALAFQVATDDSLLKDVLQVTLRTVDGLSDVLSVLVEGLLQSDVRHVDEVGLYEDCSVYVRLFGALFKCNAELKRYLIHKDSACGEVLKEAFLRSVTTLLACEDAAAMNEFVLTSSVYLRCCEEQSDAFLELIATDEEAVAIRKLLEAGPAVSEEREPAVVEKPTVAEEAKAEEAKAEKEKAEEANAEKEKPEEAKAEEVEEEVKEEEKEEGKVEEKEEVSQTEPTNTSSTYLWCLLLEVSLGSRHTIVPHLTRLLLQAFSHQTAPSDIALTHLPLLTRLLQAVKTEEQRGDFHAAAFDVQLRAYLHLFSALAFSPASVRPYTALLEQTLGLETVCCLALRFFYLARVRAIVKAGTTNGLSAIAVDRPFVELMERVYHRFKNALFDYYLGSAPAGDEETALVINNYKELIRIQDADQRLLQLVQMAAGGAGIEQVEEFASKDKELEALAKKVTELEQDVFDWKGRFSEKEEALRARDQAFEQVEYELEEARRQHAAAEAARAELAAKEEKEAETHEQEMSGMLQSLNKKEEQLRELNESADHLEAVIRELRAELQRNQTEAKDTAAAYEAQLAKARQELGAAQASSAQLEKRVGSLNRDYAAVEEELEETKKTVVELMGRREHTRDQTRELERERKEKEALRAELEKVKKGRDDLEVMLNEVLESKKNLEGLVRALTPQTLSPRAVSPEEGAAQEEPVAEQAIEEEKEQMVEEQTTEEPTAEKVEEQQPEQPTEQMGEQTEEKMEEQQMEQPTPEPETQTPMQEVTAQDFFAAPSPFMNKKKS